MEKNNIKKERSKWTDKEQRDQEEGYRTLGYKPAEIKSKYFPTRAYSTVLNRIKDLIAKGKKNMV